MTPFEWLVIAYLAAILSEVTSYASVKWLSAGVCAIALAGTFIAA